MRLVGLALVVGGCVLTEEEFRVEADEALCGWSAACFPEYGTYEDCLADASERDDDEACTYVPERGRHCVAGLREMQCPAAEADPTFPSACDEVWDCP